tara:strand:- start:661 stop:909 length:249 start_codon:yes stop_codon:yes gene_type:complete
MNTREPNNMTPEDFEESVVELWKKGFVEIYKDENGEDSIRLTGIGKKMAEELMIEEIVKEVDIKKYTRSENNRSKWYGNRMN